MRYNKQSYNMIIPFHNSLYNSEKNDRLWAFSCKALNRQTTCQWSSSLNNYWEPFNFNCGGGKVISGAYAEHSRLFKDRRSVGFIAGKNIKTTFSDNKFVHEC